MIVHHKSSELSKAGCHRCCTQLQNVTVFKSGREILSQINLHLHCGELVALVGPNGGGKTTLLKTLLGEMDYSGKILFHSEKSHQKQSKLKIGYVPQDISFDHSLPLTVEDLFALSLEVKDYSMLHRVDAFHLLKRQVGVLSGGELQRVFLALALTPIPNLLILDEPTSGVDIKGSALLYNLVSSLKTEFDISVLMVAHDLVRVSHIADRMIFLNGKIIADGHPIAVFKNRSVIEILGGDLTHEESTHV